MVRALIVPSLLLGVAWAGPAGAQTLEEEISDRPGIRGVVVDRSTRAPIPDAFHAKKGSQVTGHRHPSPS